MVETRLFAEKLDRMVRWLRTTVYLQDKDLAALLLHVVHNKKKL